MTSHPVIRISEPRELIAYVPYGLGIEPRDSLVAVSLRVRDGRVGLVARVDLAAFADERSGAATAAMLAARMADDGAARVVVILYTSLSEAQVLRGDSLEGRAVDHVLDALGTRPLADLLVVHRDGYRSLLCEDPTCCPDGGRPLSELESTMVGAEMVYAGQRVVRDRADLRVRGEAPARDRRLAGRAAAAERGRRRAEGRDRPAGPGRPRVPAGWAEAMLALWVAQCARLRDHLVPEPEALGRLLAALEVPLVRDALVLTVAERGPEAAPTSLADALAGLGGAAGARPVPARADDARAVLEAVARHASGRARATPLATLACLEWWSGNGARANVLVEQSLEADPTSRLGRTLLDALAVGLAPGWAYGDDSCEDGPWALSW